MADVLAAGFFDGVHRGHRKILEGADIALTFRNHPSEVLDPMRKVPLLMSFEDKLEALKACGVREVVAFDFTAELASQEPEDFIANFNGVKTVRCGANWRFGRRGRGDAQFLRECGFSVDIVGYERCGEEVVSSTKIREAIQRGDLAKANAMLGRTWVVGGTVVKGKGLGSKIGFPTLNVKLSEHAGLLPCGVYEVLVDGMKAVANFGYAPTMGADAWNERILEMNFRGSVPPASEGGCRVGFVRYLRPERKFDSLEALKAQISEDAKAVFGGR